MADWQWLVMHLAFLHPREGRLFLPPSNAVRDRLIYPFVFADHHKHGNRHVKGIGGMMS